MLGLEACCPRLVMGCRVLVTPLDCVYPHDKQSFIVWSPFGVTNSGVKLRSGDNLKVPLSSMLSSGSGWQHVV